MATGTLQYFDSTFLQDFHLSVGKHQTPHFTKNSAHPVCSAKALLTRGGKLLLC